MNKITIVDSIMGSGKTSWAKQYMMKNKDDKKFLYVSPYLNEIENNLKKDCSFLREPDAKLGGGSKLEHLKELLKSGENIVTTHALFGMFDKEVEDLLEDSGYTLIMDEVANVIEKVDKITNHDIELMLESRAIKVEDRKVIWLKDDYQGVYDNRYANIKYHAQQGNLYSHHNNLLMWTFPAQIFKLFDETYVLTYLFDGQIQRYYYDMFDIRYTYKSVEQLGESYCLVDYDRLSEQRSRYKNLINIYEGKLNSNYINGKKIKGNEFSSSWLRTLGDNEIKRIKKNLYTYFRGQGKSIDNLWTTKKSMEGKFRGKGYTKGFIPWTTRATNDYQEKHNLAFVYNLYMKPFEKQFFEDAGVRVNQDLLAVSNLLQWIWRSAIRKKDAEPINIYIPSIRMRSLLNQWLNNDEIKFEI